MPPASRVKVKKEPKRRGQRSLPSVSTSDPDTTTGPEEAALSDAANIVAPELTAKRAQIHTDTSSDEHDDDEKDPVLRSEMRRLEHKVLKKEKDIEAAKRNPKIDRENPFPAPKGFWGFIVVTLLLVLMGIRPKRIGADLKNPKKDPVKVWTAYRDALCKRYTTLGTMSGLMLAATATMTPPTEAKAYMDYTTVQRLPYALAITGRYLALISAAFSTGLALCLAEADPVDFRKLASRPAHMLIPLSVPAAGSISAFLLFYFSIAVTQFEAANLMTQIPTVVLGVWALCVLIYCLVLFHRISYDKGWQKRAMRS